VYGDPSLRLPVVGVTGTNGKTTVTHMLEQIVVATSLYPHALPD
jgi:UDP-N-acetylmuramoyl-L-alanyl-D-glutamate--2,6-diaminopimelate ligase